MMMRWNRAILVVVLLFIGKQTGFSQSFLNLDFEQAKIVPILGGEYGGSSIAVTNALPDWSVYYGANQQSQITYNDPALGSTFVSLIATNGDQLAGNYSVLLQGGATASAATIAQTGLIPGNAESLTFIAVGNTTLGISSLQVLIDNQEVSFSVISNLLNSTLYGANVSAFANQDDTLSFSALEASIGYNNWEIDNIQFSSTPVPEPSEYALIGLGATALFALRHRHKPQR
jgi:hypothetical protein